MSDVDWEGTGPEWTLDWGGRLWTLAVDEPNPGLSSRFCGWSATLLSLDGLAAPGRFARDAFTAATLVDFELHRSRLLATFLPPGWGDLTVRAAWEPNKDRGSVELEVQVSATSVGILKNLEVAVLSRWALSEAQDWRTMAGWVEPRDARAAALSYDGREPEDVLGALTTLPVPRGSQLKMPPRVVAPPGEIHQLSYVELVQPNDVARRITFERALQGQAREIGLATRYGLFGHDLEKGVVLRARLRGFWLDSRTPEDDARAHYQDFLREPPPLGP